MTHERGTDAGRWSRVEPILDRLLDAEDGTARATVLAEVRSSDPTLASDVATAYEALLKNEDLLARPFSVAVPDLLADFARGKPIDLDESESSRCGRILGSYRLIEVLDRGGMGVVYVAERADDQFEMRVAVKLLPRGLESPEAERRFLTERQILADLEHPHIARLLDGGLTDEGYPYLVMELVDGQPIDEYCRHHDLDLERRLRLFLQVLNAVQHAHQHMVIHRDLKPSNILVTADGTVKLLDFGIAKLADPAAATEGASTLFQPRSIRYASPEQVANRPVSAASDVYSLGVVLYQLLTGVVPLELDQLSPGERERVVREVLPEPPSTRSRRWRRRLRGDLDNIVLEALRKDPARRYPTAAHLAADIERYLRDEPVSARKRTWSYSARKFLSRHRVGALLATGVLALLLVFVSTVIRQEKRALAEARKAERVAELLAELFEGANPFSAEVGTRDLKSILDRAEARIRDQLASEPEIRAELLEVIGRAYSGLGLFSQAAALHEEALEIRRSLFGPEDLRVAESSLSLGTALESRGDYEEAQSLYERALAIFESKAGEDSPEVGTVLTRLGRLIAHRGDPAGGVERLTRAVQIFEQQTEAPDIRLARASSELAAAWDLQGSVERAVELKRRALTISDRAVGRDHPTGAVIRSDLAISLQALGRFDEAEQMYLESAEISSRLLGDDHPTVADTLTSLGKLLMEQGRYEEARPHVERAVAINQQQREPSHIFRVAAEINLGTLRRELGDLDGAEALYRDALERFEEILGSDDPGTARVVSLLAQTVHLKGDLDRAESLYRRALASQRAMPTRRLNVTESLLGLGSLLCLRGETGEAESLVREALNIRRELLPEGHWRIAEAEMEWSQLLLRQNRPTEAARLLARAERVLSNSLVSSDRRVTRARELLARIPVSTSVG